MNDEKEQGRAGRQLMAGAAAIIAVAVFAVAALHENREKADQPPPPVSQAGSVGEDGVKEGCQLVQRLHYTPCGHEMTRRLDAPSELWGKDREDVEAAYDQWRITSFAPGEIAMELKLDIPCSRHLVLMPDEAGVLGIFENKYGDALAFVRSLEIPLQSLSQAAAEEVRPGKCFDTLEALEQWLESVES